MTVLPPPPESVADVAREVRGGREVQNSLKELGDAAARCLARGAPLPPSMWQERPLPVPDPRLQAYLAAVATRLAQMAGAPPPLWVAAYQMPPRLYEVMSWVPRKAEAFKAAARRT